MKHMDSGNLLMNAKRQLLIFLIGGMAFIVSLVVVCAALCPTDSYGKQFPASTDYTITSHAFVPISNGASAIFILLLLGFFAVLNQFIISDGFYLSVFRPPRFHT